MLVTLVLVIAACGDDEAATTSSAATTASSAESSTSAAPTPTATTAAPATTTNAAVTPPAGPTDCLEIWPEATVQAVAGAEYTFFDANADRSACTYTSLPQGIALAWRDSDLDGFEASKSGTAAVGETEDVAICDAGFFTELQGAIIIMEGFSTSQGRAYNATISGVDLEDARAWAETLIQGACG